MKLLVCGGAGFIGSTFARLRLIEHGDEVATNRYTTSIEHKPA